MRTAIRLPELLDQPLYVIAKEILTALFAQGAFAIDPVSSACQYTTSNTPGGELHCAVGLALPDDVNPPNGESAVRVCDSHGWSVGHTEAVALLTDLQTLHDRAALLLGAGNQVLGSDHMYRVLRATWFHMYYDTATHAGPALYPHLELLDRALSAQRPG